MKTTGRRHKLWMGIAGILTAVGMGTAWAAHEPHVITGITGVNFTVTAREGYINTAEGNSIYMWGYAEGTNEMQYPGPTLILGEDQVVTVTLYNELPVPVSIVFPGQTGVSAVGGVAGLLTQELPAGAPGAPSGPVTYSFTPSEPGTYMYHSGTQWDLQVEMGLTGAIIVRPATFDQVANRIAYNHADTEYFHENLFFLTDMDENIHDLVESQVLNNQPVVADMTKWYPQYWFMNGRSGMDTLQPAGVSWLPNQPYDALVLIHATARTLQRIVGAGRDSHPFHHHGNDGVVIARDGRLLSSAPGNGPDLSFEQFTNPSQPDTTWDQIFVWTGEGLGWDVYGHAPGDPILPGEYAPDHGKPFPVSLPPEQDVTYGMLYSGSPFLGAQGALPPGEGGFNPGVFMYMWHSHNERELCDGNIFPGGMMTFLMIAAP